MLQINCSFLEEPLLDSEISGFDLGHMEIKGNKGNCSSKSRGDGWSMMLVLSIIIFLDGIRRFMSSPNKEYIFGAIDCSFSLRFSKKGPNVVEIYFNNCIIESTDLMQLKIDVGNSLIPFSKKILEFLPCRDPSYEDLIKAINDFDSPVT